MRGVLGDASLEESVLPLSIRSLICEIRRGGAANLAALDGFGAGIRARYGARTEDAVLAGDAAALAALYGDAGAFKPAGWEVLLKDGTCANGTKTRKLAPPADAWSEEFQFGAARWRRPGPALLLWKDSTPVAGVLKLAYGLGCRDEVEHGLAIASHIFPELKEWAHPEWWWSMPQWERKWAVPLAARRVVLVNYE